MYFLEDDFNDSLYHFGIAVERQRINSGSLRKDIKRLQAIIKRNELYTYKYYVDGVRNLEILDHAKNSPHHAKNCRRYRFFSCRLAHYNQTIPIKYDAAGIRNLKVLDHAKNSQRYRFFSCKPLYNSQITSFTKLLIADYRG
jgi:hypothetical protein